MITTSDFAKKHNFYIGLMSGTSLDGVDGVIVSLPSSDSPQTTPSSNLPLQVIAHTHIPMPADLRNTMFTLNTAGYNELHHAALAANQLVSTLYAPAVHNLLQQSHIHPQQVKAIGAHGQTVRHHPHLLPPDANQVGYSIQLNAPALLAELTGIAVVCDFRSRDIAASGHGAPLVPAFHASMFGQPHKTIGILNLGGIANLTVLNPALAADTSIIGFDCGPANTLMDLWCEQHKNIPFDADGAWSASGTPLPELLANMLEEPYFQQSAPKSTGRDLFNMAWLIHHLKPYMHLYPDTRPEDIQATLLELTAHTCAKALQRYAPNATELIVCGGGALNTQLMKRLQSLIELTQPTPVVNSAQRGLPPLQVEAAAFAWLAHQCINLQSANLPSVTGAKGSRILGAIYSA